MGLRLHYSQFIRKPKRTKGSVHSEEFITKWWKEHKNIQFRPHEDMIDFARSLRRPD